MCRYSRVAWIFSAATPSHRYKHRAAVRPAIQPCEPSPNFRPSQSQTSPLISAVCRLLLQCLAGSRFSHVCRLRICVVYNAYLPTCHFPCPTLITIFDQVVELTRTKSLLDTPLLLAPNKFACQRHKCLQPNHRHSTESFL